MIRSEAEFRAWALGVPQHTAADMEARYQALSPAERVPFELQRRALLEIARAAVNTPIDTPKYPNWVGEGVPDMEGAV